MAAGHPVQQCIYCERVLAVALLTLLVVGGLSALALAAAGYLEEAHPDEGGPTAHGEGVKSPQEIAPEPSSDGWRAAPRTLSPEAHRGRVSAGRLFSDKMTDTLPTARTMLHQDAWLCLLVWCKACNHQAPANLQAVIDSGRGDVPLKDLRFRCTKCHSALTDAVVMSRDALAVQPWRHEAAAASQATRGDRAAPTGGDQLVPSGLPDLD